MNGQDKVLDHTREQLSALFDGELALDEARFLERRLQHDASLAGCVSRWQAIGDAMRGQGMALAPAGFSERVAVAVAAEAAPPPAARHAAGLRRGWMPGAALAASVALVAFFATRQSPVATPAGDAPAVQVAQASASDATATPGVPRVPAPQAPDRQVAQLAAAVAVAEVPRRAAARRAPSSRNGQAQRAAATRTSRQSAIDAQPQFAVASAAPLPASVAPENPFAPAEAASHQAVVSRPWPRALLSNAGTLTVGYGNLQPNPLQVERDAFHPFRPRIVAGAAAPRDDARDVQDAQDAGGAPAP